MDSFSKTLKDIRDLKIQGAASIAKEASKAFVKKALESNTTSSKDFLKELERLKKKVFATRPTEPFMRNLINYLIFSISKIEYKYQKQQLKVNLTKTLQWIRKCDRDMSMAGSNKIKKGFIVYTHCHSSSVINILKEAKARKIDFEVHNTETRPLYQGRKTAIELTSYNIPVRHYVDSAARLALKKADMMIIGADAITTEAKVINKIGSELISEAAYRLNVPVYVCTHSWKFDSQTQSGFDVDIEKRAESEIWPKRPKKVSIDNFAFERVDPSLITGIISELGILTPQNFLSEVRRKYEWMFK